MKWAVAALAVVLAFGATARAAEEKVLYCVDTDINGFVWENGKATRQWFFPERFVVKVLPNGDRIIGDKRFECLPVSGVFICTYPDLPAIPWIFKGNNYTRAFLYGGTVAGDPNIWVSYGTCTDF